MRRGRFQALAVLALAAAATAATVAGGAGAGQQAVSGKLTMVGIGPLEPTIRKRLPPNVELLTWVSRETLVRLYERAGGFIHLGEEDFGIVPLEAQACGRPVVALARGGAVETVIPGTSGALVDEQHAPAFADAFPNSGERTSDSARGPIGRQSD